MGDSAGNSVEKTETGSGSGAVKERGVAGDKPADVSSVERAARAKAKSEKKAAYARKRYWDKKGAAPPPVDGRTLRHGGTASDAAVKKPAQPAAAVTMDYEDLEYRSSDDDDGDDSPPHQARMAEAPPPRAVAPRRKEENPRRRKKADEGGVPGWLIAVAAIGGGLWLSSRLGQAPPPAPARPATEHQGLPSWST